MLRLAAGLFGVLVFVCSGPTRAEMVEASPADSARYRFSEVTVEAPRTFTSAGGAAAVEVSVDTLGVSAAPSAEEILRELPLLHVRSNSRGEAEISARGSESRQVAVLVDGIPITLAWDARADVSVIPGTGIDHVVFVRGLSSMLYGPNVLGGIVEASVGKSSVQPERSKTRVSVGGDHVGGWSTSASGSVPFYSDSGEWLLRGGIGYRRSPGDPLARDVVEPSPSDDDLRVNTDEEKVDGFVSLRYLHDTGAWIAFSGSSFRMDRGIAAELGVADEDARFWRYPHVDRTLAVISAGTGFHRSPFGGEGDIEASVGLDRGRTDIDAYTNREYEEVSGWENGDHSTLTLRLLADQTVGSRGDLRGSFTVATIDHEEDLPDARATYQQRLFGLGVENDWKLIQSGGRLNSLSLTVGGAWDVADTPKTGGRESLGRLTEWGGRLGISGALSQGRIVLHTGVSRRGRFPALRELYSGSLGRFAPNPDLRPETLVTIEAGVTSRVGSGEFQAVLFHNLLQDAVVRTTLPDRRFYRVNRDELRSAGIELLGAHAAGPFRFSGSLTWQSVELTDTDSGERREPENLPEVLGSLAVQLPLPRNHRVGADVDVTGTQFAIDGVTGEDTELDAAAVFSVFASRTWRPDLPYGGGTFRFLEARVGVDNVGGVARYDAFGLPSPGRRARFELKVY